MEDKKYLYGAAIQGIQSFIFQTNKMKDISGASELVNFICEEYFEELLQDLKIKGEKILLAAGNIKYEFNSKCDCAKIVNIFPQAVQLKALGITISQAVVECSNNFEDDIFSLETKLRIQRNKVSSPIITGNIGMLHSRQTGLPTVKVEEDIFIDESTLKKHESYAKNTKKLYDKALEINLTYDRLPFDISDIEGVNSWIAVIHADGNGLGQVVKSIGKDKKSLVGFSEALNQSTINASNLAYNFIKNKFIDKNDVIPIRPIVLGGDDLTIICRGDFAIEYTLEFLRNFEIETKKNLGHLICNEKVKVFENNVDYLTACAGISFIKSSYPFYYGYELAENLCKYAKSDAKNENSTREIAPSCLMYYKVHDSFIDSYESIREKRFSCNNKVSYDFGPYYLNNRGDRWTIDKLLIVCDRLFNNSPLKSNVRSLLTLFSKDEEIAIQRLDDLRKRTTDINLLNELTSDKYNKNKISCDDVLSLFSVKYNESK